jgi:hypothetical protein
MNARVLVRASVLAAVLGAVGLFFAVGLRRGPPPAVPVAPATQPAR